jgi:hypothetical protein
MNGGLSMAASDGRFGWPIGFCMNPDCPTFSPSRRLLVPQKHIARAFKDASGGADRSTDDRTHGTGSSGPTLAPGLHPRDGAGYRASIPRRLRRCG